MGLRTWLGRWALLLTIVASLTTPLEGQAGGESSVGSGISPLSVAQIAYEQLDEVRNAKAELKQLGYLPLTRHAIETTIGGNCRIFDQEQNLCDLVLLVQTAFYKAGNPIRTVTAIVKVEARGVSGKATFISESKFQRAIQDLVIPNQDLF